MFKPDRQKRVKGGLRPFSSAPCRVKGQRPLWGLGQRPNGCSCDQLCKSTQSCPTSAEQRSAFSAALVTLRSRRSAPKLLYPQLAHCRARWARPTSRRNNFPNAGLFCCREFRLCGDEKGAIKTAERLRSPPTPLRSALPCCLIFSAQNPLSFQKSGAPSHLAGNAAFAC